MVAVRGLEEKGRKLCRKSGKTADVVLATLVRHHRRLCLTVSRIARKRGCLPLAMVSHQLHSWREAFHHDRLHTLQQATRPNHKMKRLEKSS